MVRRTVRERAVCVACPRLGREVVVSLHIRVYYERAGLRGDGDVQIREPELATLVRIIYNRAALGPGWASVLRH